MSPEERRQFRVTYVANRLGKYAQNLAHGRMDRIAHDVFDFLWYRCRQKAYAIAQVVFGRLNRPVPRALRSDDLILVAAWHRYAPSRYSGRLVLFSAAGREPEYGNDPTLGWKTWAAGAIDIHTVPGDHRSIMHPPDVQVLAERIMPYLAGC
jgi:thioesterase domain-containing protein